ncbi:MAG: hypothetical protein KF763_15115 [Cyclobacteriaceae bacterium]|nr:hypothetical protein [Cyclobacteriaceae bacterium]
MKWFFWRCISMRATKPLIDLLIVITGVTIAFLLGSWNEHSKEKVERTKVINSLRAELHALDSLFPSMAEYQMKVVTHWDTLLVKKEVGDFYGYRFIQPQYNYAVIEYALNSSSNVVDFTLHQKLLELYRFIKMLEQTEVYMTELALQYQPALDNLLVKERNYFCFHGLTCFRKTELRSYGKSHTGQKRY